MIPERPVLERRVLAAVEGSADGAVRIPVLVGACGSGRTSLLLRLRELIGSGSAQYIDVEKVATTPERFLRSVRAASPFSAHHDRGSGPEGEAGAREAFHAALAFFGAPGHAGHAATFLLDEFLELRTFESFPGLRSVLREFLSSLAASRNRFVLTSRYTARTHRLLRDAPAAFEIIHVAPLTAAEVRATLPGGITSSTGAADDDDDRARDELARLIEALSDGRPAYARIIAEASAAMAHRGVADPIGALAALLAPGGTLSNACRFCYELRLHRARGYGALKAILDVLAEEEPLTLTEIALRLRRTPGSTKDYLSWLEDVDLIVSRQKRYSLADPLMRLWIRLHGRPAPPSEEDIVREVHAYVMARLPEPETQPALTVAARPPERAWGIIEID